MKPSNEMNKPASPAESQNNAYLPAQSNQQKISTRKALDHIIVKLSKGEYEKLAQELVEFKADAKFIGEFFGQKGAALMQWTLCSSNSEPLSFLFKHFPKEVKRTFEHDKDLMKSFVGAEAQLEKCGQQDEESSKVQVEKFKVLIQIDPETISSLLEQPGFFTEKLKENFKLAKAGNLLQTK